VYYIIAPAEASSNLSRFDGVKFGHRAKDYADLRHVQEDPRRRLRRRGQAPHHDRHLRAVHGYYDAYYLQAQKIRRMIADDFQAAFKDCDVIAGPVAPTVAWARRQGRPGGNYLADIFTLPARWPACPA
jgi:aspartyl-tRNA(Asn)/glutamyl-tRNA(Gln) amidotransferase subunit A